MDGRTKSILVLVGFIIVLSGGVIGVGADYDRVTNPQYTVEPTEGEPTASFEEDLTTEQQNWVYNRLGGEVSQEKEVALGETFRLDGKMYEVVETDAQSDLAPTLAIMVLNFICFLLLLWMIVHKLEDRTTPTIVVVVGVIILALSGILIYSHPLYVEAPSIGEYQSEVPDDATVYTVEQVAPDAKEDSVVGYESDAERYSVVYEKLSAEKPVPAKFDVLTDHENAYIQSDGRYYSVGTLYILNERFLSLLVIGLIGSIAVSAKAILLVKDVKD